MRKMVTLFTSLLVLLSLVASFAGVRSFGHDRYRTFTTARGETVEVQELARPPRSCFICWGRCEEPSSSSEVSPAFSISTSSGRSLGRTTLCFSSTWPVFSLSLWTLVLVLADLDRTHVRAAIDPRFPVKLAANFSFALGGMLLIKCNPVTYAEKSWKTGGIFDARPTHQPRAC